MLNGWAPGGPNNGSQLPLVHSMWERNAGDVSMEKKKKKSPKQRLTAVSAARPDRLSSAVRIVFEQLALICHLVWTCSAGRGRGGIVQLSIVSPLRERPVDTDK